MGGWCRARKAVYFQRSEARQKPMFSLMIKAFMNAPVVEYVDVPNAGGQWVMRLWCRRWIGRGMWGRRWLVVNC
jgi:hypothetical protein